MPINDTSKGIAPADLVALMALAFPGGAIAWKAQPDIVIYALLPAPAATYQSTWFDFRDLKRATVYVVNTTGQAANIQLMGNRIQSVEAPARDTAVDIGMAVACPAGGSIAIGIGTNDDWHPYLGILVTTAIAPVGGLVTVTVSSQK